jgi:hypothetical protein
MMKTADFYAASLDLLFVHRRLCLLPSASDAHPVPSAQPLLIIAVLSAKDEGLRSGIKFYEMCVSNDKANKFLFLLLSSSDLIDRYLSSLVTACFIASYQSINGKSSASIQYLSVRLLLLLLLHLTSSNQ